MTRTTLVGVAVLWMGVVVGAPSVLAQPPFQVPPVLSARELLPRDMLAGPSLQVEDRVPTDGLLGHFTLRSGFGTFVTPGRELLRIRIAELAAIQQSRPRARATCSFRRRRMQRRSRWRRS